MQPRTIEHDRVDSSPLRIGDYVAFPDRNAVSNGNGEESIEPRLMKLLVLLASDPGRVWSRDELFDAVWPDTIVTDNSLTNAVSELRKLFEDEPKDPRYIQTVRGAGYRFVAAVSEYVDDDDPTPPLEDVSVRNGSVPKPVESTVHPWIIPVSVGGTVCLVLLVLGLGRSPLLGLDRNENATHTVSALSGVETMPAVSPDGRHVAFSRFSAEGGPADVYVVDNETGESIRLTDSPGAETYPSWSPDGRTIAFFSWSLECGIVLMPASGGEWMRIHRTTCSVVGLDWSPDGASIVYSAMDPETELRRIFRLDLDTRDAVAITHPSDGSIGDYLPKFGRECCDVVFHRGRTAYEGDLYRLPDAHTAGEPERLTDFDGLIRGFDRTNEDDGLVMVGLSGTREGIWRVDGSSSEPRLTRSLGHAAMSVGANPVAGITWEGMTDEVNLRSRVLAGSDVPSRTLIASTRNDIHPDVSPAGTRLVFVSNRTGVNEIWTAAIDGSQLRKLTSLEDFGTGYPRFSPDGSRIAFESRVDRQRDVFVLDTDGGDPVRITTHPGDDLSPGWTPDGRHLLFSSRRSGEWALWKIPVDGGPASLYLNEPVRQSTWSEDGRVLYFSRRDRQGIFVFDPSTGGTRFITDGDSRHWDLAGDRLFVARVSRLMEAPELVAINQDNGEETGYGPLSFSESAIFARWGIAVTPDGGTLVEASLDRIESDLFATD